MSSPAPAPEPSGCLSWPVIVIALVFFWPLGLILLGMRLSHDRAKQMALGGVMLVIGGGIALLCLLGAIGLVTTRQEGVDTVSASVTLSLFALGGLAVAFKGQSLREKRRRVQQYVTLIVNQGLTRIDEIATACGRRDFTRVQTEVQQLVAEGFLPGYRVDALERMVLRVAEQLHTSEEVGFTCRSCGANNMVLAVGRFVRCEYCGTPIKA